MEIQQTQIIIIFFSLNRFVWYYSNNFGTHHFTGTEFTTNTRLLTIYKA